MNIAMLVLIGAFLFGVGFIIGRIGRKTDGMFIVDDNDEKTTRWILDVKIDPETIPNRKEIRLKVRKMSEE